MNAAIPQPLARGADRLAHWSAVALGFSIPISVALDNVLLALLVLGWLASGAYAAKWDAVRGNRAALAALVLFGLLLAGTLYGDRNPGDAQATLLKYVDLLWIPVLIWIFRDAITRVRALHALAISLAVIVLASYLIMWGVVPETGFLSGNASDPVVFKTRQTHGLLMAFGAFLYVHLAHVAGTARMRVLWLVLAALAVANGTLVVQGATGYLVLGMLALYFGYALKGWGGLLLATAVGTALATALVLVPGPFQQRLALIRTEISQWQPGTPNLYSSVATRLEFYRLTFEIVRDRPLLGSGTGSFPKAYEDKTRGQPALRSRNPHNEYLHMMVQLGVVGLAALLLLFYTQWRCAPRLATPMECHLARGLVLAMVVGCLFNSLLLDHTEGLLYAWLTGVLYGGLRPQDA